MLLNPESIEYCFPHYDLLYYEEREEKEEEENDDDIVKERICF